MRTTILLFLLITTLFCSADVPGNRPRPSCQISIENQNKWADYTFFYSLEYYDGLTEGDTLYPNKGFLLPGGYGAPPQGAIWAINKQSNAITEPIFIYDEEGKIAIQIDTIMGDSIIYYLRKMDIIPPIKVNHENNQKNNIYTQPFIIMSGLSILAMILIVILTLRKRKQVA